MDKVIDKKVQKKIYILLNIYSTILKFADCEALSSTVKLLFYNSKIKPANCEACKATGTATFSAASFYLATQFLQLERSSKTSLQT